MCRFGIKEYDAPLILDLPLCIAQVGGVWSVWLDPFVMTSSAQVPPRLPPPPCAKPLIGKHLAQIKCVHLGPLSV